MPLIKLCALAGLGAPLFMLVLAATASDKVQGFAIAKFIGLRGLLILVGCFLPSLLEWLPALVPPPPIWWQRPTGCHSVPQWAAASAAVWERRACRSG